VISGSDIVAKESAAEEEAPRLLERVFGRRRRSLLEAVTAAQAMSSPAMTVEPWVPAEGAAWQMVEQGVDRLPVVDRGKLVGIVTRGDLVRAFTRSDDEIAREIRDEVLPSLGLSPNDVRVTVELGKVRLEGDVPASEAEIMPRSIHRVVGVVRIETSIDVRAPA
jgi:CBS domain-containing protein